MATCSYLLKRWTLLLLGFLCLGGGTRSGVSQSGPDKSPGVSTTSSTTGTLQAAIATMDQGGNWTMANEMLLRLIQSPDVPEDSTSGALATLAIYGDETCIPHVFELLNSSSSVVTSAVEETLLNIKGRNAARTINAELLKLPSTRQAELSATLARRGDLHNLPAVSPALVVPARGPILNDLLKFERRRLSDHKFEAASVADINQDGNQDIVSGGFWYPGPAFDQTHKICDVRASGEYFDDFSDYPMDVNGDGFPDLVTGGFFGGPLRWRENPQGATSEWKEHRIAHVGPIETTRFWDVDNDGFPEICPNAAGNIIVFRLKRDAAGRGTGEFTSHTLRRGGVGHGLGFGDINGDGRGDFVGPDGWFEAPPEPLGDEKWKFHREFSLGSASVPILVHDVNGDGINDLIVGQGHDYGLHWLQQGRDEAGARSWTRHTIEADRSQFHELYLADLDDDGQPELITGKRWRAHNGNDPGADDPLGIYYYKIIGGQFHRFTLDYGPPQISSGTGIYLWVADVDGNGWQDIVAPGKQGLYLFRSLGSRPATLSR